MARKRDRAIAGFFAGLFILSTLAIGIGVVILEIQQKRDATNQAKEQKPVDNSKKLQGTPLAGFTPLPSIPALQKIDSTPGTGAEVKASDTIKVDYTGAVAASGIIFQSSKDTGQPVTFPLNQVIAGWTQGIPGMKEGGTRRLLIPAALAYGPNPPAGSGIPPNADLVFDVTLHEISK